MTFAEALLKKIALDKLTNGLKLSFASDKSSIDRKKVSELFKYSAYKPVKIRDLDLWLLEREGELPDIIVLDNGFARYKTELLDLALRKSPSLKEMLAFKNIKKILFDEDIFISRREETLEYLHAHCLELLNLKWRKEDILALAEDGGLALQIREKEDVEKTLVLFAELLKLVSPPLSWHMPDWLMYCLKTREGQSSSIRHFIAFSSLKWKIIYMKGPFLSDERELNNEVKKGLERYVFADCEGKEVFSVLAEIFLAAHKENEGVFS